MPEPTVIDGRISRKPANGLKLTFTRDGAETPIAVAHQSRGDGRGMKLGIALGFKNGGSGRHGLTHADGRDLMVESRELQPTLITTADGGAAVATFNRVGKDVHRSTAVTPDGQEIMHFTSDLTEAETRELYRVVITDAAGADLGRLHVIRKSDGWKSISDILDSAFTTTSWWDQAGAPARAPAGHPADAAAGTDPCRARRPPRRLRRHRDRPAPLHRRDELSRRTAHAARVRCCGRHALSNDGSTLRSDGAPTAMAA